MLMVAAMFTKRPIYDSIRTCDVGLSQRGLCPVAKKPILEDRESDQSVAYFVSANFGLEQPDNPPVRADVDRVGGRHLRQTRHGHDLTADRHDELGAGREPHLAHID